LENKALQFALSEQLMKNEMVQYLQKITDEVNIVVGELRAMILAGVTIHALWRADNGRR
jgi:CII-binding regulator of phage lambda lysogenization HflD